MHTNTHTERGGEEGGGRKKEWKRRREKVAITWDPFSR